MLISRCTILHMCTCILYNYLPYEDDASGGDASCGDASMGDDSVYDTSVDNASVDDEQYSDMSPTKYINLYHIIILISEIGYLTK